MRRFSSFRQTRRPDPSRFDQHFFYIVVYVYKGAQIFWSLGTRDINSKKLAIFLIV